MFPVCSVTYVPGLYRARSCHGPALARQPSCLVNTQESRRHGGCRSPVVAPQLLGGNRRAASASARGPWPCSLGSSRWADGHNAFARASINQPHFGTTMSRPSLAHAADDEHEKDMRRSATALRHEAACTCCVLSRTVITRGEFSYSAAALRHVGQDGSSWLRQHDLKSKEAGLPI